MKNKTNIIHNIIRIVILAVFIYAVYMIVSQLNDYRKASNIYQNAVEEYVFVKTENIDADTPWEELLDANVPEIRKQNSDIVGWIYFENTDINYPILHSEDNLTYLRKTYTGESAMAGSIMLEAENNSDFSDVHTIIYGHNMKDDTMFGGLKNYMLDSDYIREHNHFQIITENAKYRYKVLSYKIVSPDSNVYAVYQSGDENFLEFIKNVLHSESVYLDTDTDVGVDDHIITLSTCSGDDRLIVTAIRDGAMIK